MNRRLINTKELAELLGVRPGTIRHWTSQKKISYVKVGRLTKFDLREIENFIKKHTIPAKSLYEILNKKM